jgi:large subunit ribosomal protein L7/L12
MAEKMSVEDIVSAIESLSVLELSQLVKELEERFGVTAQMPVVAPTGAGGVAQAAPAEEAQEKTEFTVVLKSVGDKKIQVLKEVRALTGLGLKEAKELIDNLPKPIKEGVSKEEAEKIKATLEGAGATVEIQ